MKIYLVGGAVRDELLGREVHERDWVVVGANPDTMLKLGYQPVGKDFPVFLHPQTHEEYALARTERKTAAGYTGFVCYASEEVTLEEDLKRRDLTINAIAKSESGELIDPYGGQSDLRAGILRHVSPAFEEDPVRILRVARFAARFANFRVHPDTMTLMSSMSQTRELDALVPERVWRELERALQEPFLVEFFTVLQSCQAMAKLFPELEKILVDALARSVKLSSESPVRLAVLLHSISNTSIKQFSKRLRIPNVYSDLACMVSRWHTDYAKLLNLNAGDWLNLLNQTDAFRRPERFGQFLLACAATLSDASLGLQYNHYLETALEQTRKVMGIAFLLNKGLKGQALGQELNKQRERVIAEYLSSINSCEEKRSESSEGGNVSSSA